MSNSYRNSASTVLEDYTQLNTIPALLSVAFVAAGLYTFGGISDITIVWLSNYSLTGTHALGISLGVYAVAFMSSETRDFAHYEDWEKVLIAGGPALMIAYEYWQPATDLINTTSNLGPIAAFLVTVAAWGVAVR